MTMRVHTHDSGDLQGADRGRELGASWSGQIQAAVGLYRGLFDELTIDASVGVSIADASLQALADWAPELGDELQAIADGAGCSPTEIALLNARTEVLAARPRPGEGECSTAVRVGERPVAFQTWDWYARLVPDAVLWRYSDGRGGWVKTFTEPGMLAKIGVNAAGLSANFNILHHRSDNTSGGVPVHAIARRILDQAGSVDEAAEIAGSAPASASSVITVLTGGPQATAASIEIAPAGTALVTPDSNGWLIHTNHFLDPELAVGGVIDPISTTRARYEHLIGEVQRGGLDAELTEPDLATMAPALCGSLGDEAPICLNPDSDDTVPPKVRTLISVLLDPSTGRFDYWPGSPGTVVGGAPQQF